MLRAVSATKLNNDNVLLITSKKHTLCGHATGFGQGDASNYTNCTLY